MGGATTVAVVSAKDEHNRDSQVDIVSNSVLDYHCEEGKQTYAMSSVISLESMVQESLVASIFDSCLLHQVSRFVEKMKDATFFVGLDRFFAPYLLGEADARSPNEPRSTLMRLICTTILEHLHGQKEKSLSFGAVEVRAGRVNDLIVSGTAMAGAGMSGGLRISMQTATDKKTGRERLTLAGLTREPVDSLLTFDKVLRMRMHNATMKDNDLTGHITFQFTVTEGNSSANLTIVGLMSPIPGTSDRAMVDIGASLRQLTLLAEGGKPGMSWNSHPLLQLSHAAETQSTTVLFHYGFDAVRDGVFLALSDALGTCMTTVPYTSTFIPDAGAVKQAIGGEWSAAYDLVAPLTSMKVPKTVERARRASSASVGSKTAGSQWKKALETAVKTEDDARRALNAEKAQRTQLQKRVGELKAEVKAKELEVEAAVSASEEMKGVFDARILAVVTRAEELAAEHAARLDELMKERQVFTDEMAQMRRRFNDVEARAVELREENDRITVEYESLTIEKADVSTALDQTQSRATGLEGRVRELEAELKRYREGEATTGAMLGELRTQILEFTDTVGTVTREAEEAGQARDLFESVVQESSRTLTTSLASSVEQIQAVLKNSGGLPVSQVVATRFGQALTAADSVDGHSGLQDQTAAAATLIQIMPDLVMELKAGALDGGDGDEYDSPLPVFVEGGSLAEEQADTPTELEQFADVEPEEPEKNEDHECETEDVTDAPATPSVPVDITPQETPEYDDGPEVGSPLVTSPDRDDWVGSAVSSALASMTW
ncbi:chromosome segregation protein [Carpediemonas membranifera]|uniref:Chromosome segregation protein n=1 Tax=Carpediemonas membranifera TaxID=201153 RepID=A0A8J6DZ90_9EUKA|nr:chromosome segregation protein [Carpediemonas membranifera]|eukprot:KAG9393309.1 chromosome segregation protein [Carpediemonas membranifera]